MSGVVVRDAAGREVLTPTGPSNASTLDIGGLAPGTYLVEVRHSAGIAIERLVVRR